MNNPAISIVMPAFNAEKYISEAIESTLAQSFTDFELIIIDDGSTDSTVRIARSYSDSRIVLMENSHDFIASLNLGIDIAKGKYIARMDADDRMFPDRLKIQYGIMEADSEITVCGGWMQVFGENIAENSIFKLHAGCIDNPLHKLLNSSIIFHPTAMMRKDFLMKNGIRYDYYPHAEDYKLWLEIAKKGGKFYVESAPLLYYRISENQVSRIHSDIQNETGKKVKLETFEFLIEKAKTKIQRKNKPVSNPLISVIMPVYNAEKYVREATESILAQTFKDFEFIIIDDASTDGTKAVLDSISDGRIRRINNSSNLGNYRSRNAGLEISKGKYICVMDADDISVPERLEKQLHFMENNSQYAAVGSDLVFFSETLLPRSVQRLRDSQEIKVQLLKDNVCTHPTLIIRREILNRHCVKYDENYYYSADYKLLADISRIGNITNMPEYLLFYRQHLQQITVSKQREQQIYRDRIQVLQLDVLKLRPSVEEMIIHSALMNVYPLSQSQLEKAEKWCNKLLLKNSKLNIFNQDYLFRFLEERLSEAVRNSF
ncbi:MAG: glycosyltransferase [Dysgonamonadaceae bacterium]|jgi:glycosyltransferase involved in cell wall biosynthesis|nr:glycosyltransferase [Dysgonamonadaceae bacterium]